jgi:dolichol-phosphate mannosyltransferase
MSNPSHLESDIKQMTKYGLRVAVVGPCYNVQKHIVGALQTIPEYVHYIIAVNDASQDNTGDLIDDLSDNKRIHAIHLPYNHGVGGAMLVGFAEAINLGADIIVKMDGDGQMDPENLPLLIEPLLKGKADYAKGNRFMSFSLDQMPIIRRVGNAVLSFLAKLASGYWNIFDPTNGYIAIRRELLESLPTKYISQGYFFENSMLIAAGIQRAVVLDIPIKARYGTEKSNLNITRVLFQFPIHLIIGFLRRIWLRKILYSLTMEAILGIFGILLIMIGAIFGISKFIDYAVIQSVPAPAGTVMVAALPIFLGFQMLMNAIILDIQSVPSTPLCDKYTTNTIDDSIQKLASSKEETRIYHHVF